MEYIHTAFAPVPAGHYSQAVVANGFIFVSGQIPVIPGPERKVPMGITAQFDQVFANLRAILKEAKADFNDLVSVQLFITNMSLWSEINALYQRTMGSHKPARTVVPCGLLNNGALIEVNAVAICRAER